MPDTNEDEALKKKFQQLQLQQQQKLENRKLKKQKAQQKRNSQEVKSSEPRPAADEKLPANAEKSVTPAFGVTDELDLKVINLVESDL